MSALGPDHVTWHTLKLIINNEKYITHIVCLANICIDLLTWPSHFKESTSVIIPKPQKASYDSPKSFYPIYYDLITQVATLALRLEDRLRVRGKGMHNRLSIRRYSISTGAYILIVVQELGLQRLGKG